MATIVSGSEAAKQTGLALAQIYNHIRAGRVKQHKADGWPEGKGVEVDIDELKSAIANHSRTPRASKGPKAPREGKTSRKAREEAFHEALENESEEKRAKRAAARAHDDGGNTVRVRRYERNAFVACPVNPNHGSMYKMDRGSAKGPDKYHCAHQQHDGRPKNHPAGFAPQTQNVFTADELNIPSPIGQLGEIMLGWISAGRTDLAESLESWMTKNKLDVWIPVR